MEDGGDETRALVGRNRSYEYGWHPDGRFAPDAANWDWSERPRDDDSRSTAVRRIVPEREAFLAELRRSVRGSSRNGPADETWAKLGRRCHQLGESEWRDLARRLKEEAASSHNEAAVLSLLRTRLAFLSAGSRPSPGRSAERTKDRQRRPTRG